MGEEKPDEELMGKRKSSPRMSTASCNADTCMIAFFWSIIPTRIKMYAILRFFLRAWSQ